MIHYQPTRESVSTHPVPDWFHDAKFGIFVHWGLYSVPGWAPLAGELGEVLAGGDWARWFANNPYAEWYMNSMRIPGSPTQQHHEATFGADHSYFDFTPKFNTAAQGWDPDIWAGLFERVHARYVVLTTKHHDGFLLWPSRHPNPFIPGYQADRDLVGELAAAARRRGLVLGLYYSGGLDWTFNDKVIQDIADIPAAVPQTPEYVAYANAHWQELIERYEPKVLWNDIAYPAATDLNALFAGYYNRIPDGVVNNRFTQHFRMGEQSIASDNHYDFDTPEYAVFPDIRAKKWEACRGIGASFGYNQNEGEAQYLSVEQLVHSLIDIVSKNGNLLLNVGPMADGTIPELHRTRLEGLGRWLDICGEAIFDTQPWTVAEAQTGDGAAVRFTQKGEQLYALVLAEPVAGPVEIVGLVCRPESTIRLLGRDEPPAWRQGDRGVVVELPGGLEETPAYALAITPPPILAAM